MSDEITGYRGFHPASEAYVVKDFFRLLGEREPKLLVRYTSPTLGGDPALSGAGFTLIRSFKTFNGEIKLINMLIEGQFTVTLMDKALVAQGLSRRNGRSITISA